MSEQQRRHRSSLDLGYLPHSRLKDNGISPRDRHKRRFSERYENDLSFDTDDCKYSSPAKIRRTTPHPMFCRYQLVGDSLLLRFAEQVLWERCIYDNGMRYLGLCVSGQTIEELTKRIERNFSPVAENIILLIGTNNLLQDANVEDMETSIVRLLDLLDASAKEIVLLTLPPIPKLEHLPSFWRKFDRYNNFLHSLSATRKNIVVEDITKLFLNEEHDCEMDYFERWYDKQQRRPDLIHLNRAGLLLIKTHLCEKGILQLSSTSQKTNSLA